MGMLASAEKPLEAELVLQIVCIIHQSHESSGQFGFSIEQFPVFYIRPRSIPASTGQIILSESELHPI